MSSEDIPLSFADFQNTVLLPFNNENVRFSVSSTFGPTGPISAEGIPTPVDMMLLSNDFVVFCTHEATLLNLSDNFFQSSLPLPTPALGGSLDSSSERILYLPDIPSSELEIMLHVVHNIQMEPSLSLIDIGTLTRGIDRLSQYGIPPDTVITPTSHLYKTMLSCAPLHPLEIYALAAQYGMSALAVTVSSHTLVLEPSGISPELSRRMGSQYLLRLFQLHMERTDRLKVLLAAEMGLHNPTELCDFTNQKRLKEAWNLAIASLLFLIQPDTTTTVIRDKIMEKTSTVTCPDCLKLRDTRLNKILAEWSLTRRTIEL